MRPSPVSSTGRSEPTTSCPTPSATPFSPDIADSLEGVDGVKTVTRFRLAGAAIDGSTDRSRRRGRRRLDHTVRLTFTAGDVSGLEDRAILLDTDASDDLGVGVGDSVDVTFQGQGDADGCGSAASTSRTRSSGPTSCPPTRSPSSVATSVTTSCTSTPPKASTPLALGTRLEERLVDYPNVLLQVTRPRSRRSNAVRSTSCSTSSMRCSRWPSSSPSWAS